MPSTPALISLAGANLRGPRPLSSHTPRPVAERSSHAIGHGASYLSDQTDFLLNFRYF